MKRQYNYIKSAKFFCCLAVVVMASSLAGCKKLIDPGVPQTLINSANVYTSNTTAEAVVSSLFCALVYSGHMYNGSGSIDIQQGLAADELKSYSSSALGTTQFYTNALTAQNSYYWTEIFSELFTCNS